MAGFLAERLKKNEKLSLLLQLIIEVRVTFFLHSTFAGCVCVKLLPDSMIPPHALKGHQAVLKCNYDLEGDNLYSVKWYFNQKEFYRYIPTDNPKVTIFNHHQGVRVNVSLQKMPKSILTLASFCNYLLRKFFQKNLRINIRVLDDSCSKQKITHIIL